MTAQNEVELNGKVERINIIYIWESENSSNIHLRMECLFLHMDVLVPFRIHK